MEKVKLHLKTADPVLGTYIDRIEIPPIYKSVNYFSDLMDAIVSQQLSEKAGATIFARFQSLFPSKKLTPEYLLTIPDEKIRSTGPSWTKISYMKNIANAIISGSLPLQSLDMMDNENVITELTKIKGVGRWTAEMFLMFSLGRDDVFSTGDLGLRRAIQRIYKLKKEPTVKQLEKISAKWIPYRTYACRILWRSLSLDT